MANIGPDPEQHSADSHSQESPEHDLSLSMDEASTSVSLTSFMTALVFFFAGLLLTGAETVQERLRVPLTMLFLSAFGFMYSTLIYANATGEVARRRQRSFARQMSIANVVSEYFGVYCLVLAIPLTVLGYSPDRPLAVIVLFLSVGGLSLYHHLGYSILERYVSRRVMRALLAGLVLVTLGQFWTFYANALPAYYAFTGVLLVYLTVLTYQGIRWGQE